MRATLLAACLLLGSGCATRKVWEEGQFTRFHRAASPSNVELFASRSENRLLVVYDEELEDSERIKRRAYWQELRVEPPDNPYRPEFVRCSTNGLIRVPVLEIPAPAEFSAVAAEDGRGFTLFDDGQLVWSSRLPVYQDGSGRIKQVALTPLAIVADLTIVGGWLAALWFSGGGTF